MHLQLRMIFKGFLENDSIGTVKPMRITLVTSSLGRGGAERVISMLASSWAGQDKEVTLLRLDYGEIPAYPIDARVKLRSLGLVAESSNFVHRIFRNLNRIRVLRHAIRESRPDVVISFQSTTNVLTLLATRGLGAPVVVSEHSDPSRSDIGRGWNKLRCRTYPLAHALVCPTNSALHFFQEKIKVMGRTIPNVIAVPSAELVRYGAHPGRSSKRYTLIGMGRLVQSKGFDILLDAFSRIANSHPDWSLKILGKGPLKQELQSRAEAFGLTDRVYFAGEVRDPFPELCAADLFVFPSRFEAFGLALCEAMACGLPVVSFDCPSGPREIIRDGLDGVLVPPEDAGALSTVLHRLMNDPAERQRLASRAPEVLKRFDLARILSLWEQLFEDLTLAKQGKFVSHDRV